MCKYRLPNRSVPTGEFDLSGGKAFANLVDAKTDEDPTFLCVAPGKSSASFIIRKLDGSGAPAMPLSGKLEPAFTNSIAAWIDSGALNNESEL